MAEPTTWSLVRVEGRDLPADEGRLPPRGERWTPCHYVLADGALSLDPERRRYAFYRAHRSSCDRRLLALWSVVGGYGGSESGLILTDEDRPELTHRARLRGDTLRAWFFEKSYVFAAPAPGAPPLGGSWDLAEVDRRPIPGIPPPEPPERECWPNLRTADLVLEPGDGPAPVSGRFVLRSSATDPCTGELRRSGDAEGIYEQVGRSLVFRPGPDARYWFYRHGILREGELVFLGAGNDLILRR